MTSKSRGDALKRLIEPKCDLARETVALLAVIRASPDANLWV